MVPAAVPETSAERTEESGAGPEEGVAVRETARVAPADALPPDADLKPDQFPDAVQEVALETVQVRVEAAPEEIVVGLAVKLTTGAGSTFTVTKSSSFVFGPEQVMV